MPKKNQSWLKSETIQLALLITGAVALLSLFTNHVGPRDAVAPTVALLLALVRIAKGKDK